MAQVLSKMTGRVTSRSLSERIGWKDTLIRYDIASIGFNEGVSNGYDVRTLLDAICKALDLPESISPSSVSSDHNYEICCIVGLGRLGAALLDEGIFSESGFKIVAGFDPNVNRTEILRSTFPLYPASRMQAIIAQEKIRWALLASKNADAQMLANRLVESGIRGIVNYTDVTLALPKSVQVKNASPVTMLRMLFLQAESEQKGEKLS